jgi:exopolysaccharide biosynthesis polyprenyl glycosylphosphotransferase
VTVELTSLTKGASSTRHPGESAVDERELLGVAPHPATSDVAAVAGQVTPLEERAPRRVLWREGLKRKLLGSADVIAVALSLRVVEGSPGWHRVTLLIPAIVMLLLLFKIGGLYDRDDLRLVQSTLDEAPSLLQLTGLFTLGVTTLQWLFRGPLGTDDIPALWLGAFVAIVCGRVIARAVAGRIAPPERCLVIGDSGRVQRIRERLASSRARAMVIAAIEVTTQHLEALGTSDALTAVVRELKVDRIIVAPATDDDGGEIVGLVRMAKAIGVRVSVLPRMLEVVGSAVEFDVVDGMTMLGIRRFGLSYSSRKLKRVFDLIVVIASLVFALPLIGLIALLVRRDSPGPAFFRQIRVGRDGRHFLMLKFRSMVIDAELRRPDLLELNEAGAGLFKMAQDPRVTRLGHLLRRTSLDELPQLFNVLRGEMSLVGPRPLILDEDAQVLGLDRSRLQLTPGMTGPWQVLGFRVPMSEMLEIDYLYVTNWSLWLDVKTLLRTFRHVARGANV